MATVRNTTVHIVAYLLKAEIVESGETAIAKQPLCKHATIPEA
jgi:hypothetical protein